MPSSAKPPPAYQRPLPSPSVVISTVGVQGREAAHLTPALTLLADELRRSDGPAVVERARFIDRVGWENEVFIAYWLRREDFDRWFSRLLPWWDAPDREVGEVGLWREIIDVPSARIENIYSSPSFSVGTGRLVPDATGPIETHGYWGSMRHRLGAAATDALEGATPRPETEGDPEDTGSRRVRVDVPRNLAIIRSGQDTSRCAPDERAEYETSILPVLRAGMEYLRDHRQDSGCLASRFLQELDPTGRPTERSFGHAMFRSLGDLERWAERHPTHLAIYHRFSNFAKRRGANLKLDLWHEVAVIEPERALFEYVNCHAATGLLGQV
jgi:aldoxime dehydratase